MTRPPPDPAKLRAGDPAVTEAFRRILRAHIRGYFRHESQIHDVTQEALLELLAKLEAGADPQHPIYWALSSATNAIRRELTRLRHQAIAYESQLHGASEASSEAERAALLDAREDLRRINALLADCDEAPYRALAGALEGHDHRELAEQLGVSPGAARMTLARARADLSEQFSAKQKMDELISLAKRAGLIPRDHAPS